MFVVTAVKCAWQLAPPAGPGWLAQDEIDRLIFDTESPPAGGLPSQPPPPDGHPIRTDARAWQRLWREGDIITEADGDDPGMPRRGRRKRMARRVPWKVLSS